MRVVKISETTHTIGIVPRYYDFSDAVLTLTNTATNESEVLEHTEVINAGVLDLGFTYQFKERDKFTIKLVEGSEVIYRGKLFATEQSPQEFDITVNYFSYE